MNRQELQEQVEYHETMLEYAASHVTHHTQLAKLYRERLKKLKTATDKKIAEDMTADILKKLKTE